MTRHVIVGTGVAGVSAGLAIRSVDPGAEIVLIGHEPEKYYSRPGLAYLLSSEIPERMLFPMQARDFKARGLTVLDGIVERIDPTACSLHLRGGQEIAYDRLLVATGAAAVLPDLPGMDLKGVVKLDDFSDARRILRLARRGRRAVVVGGGITALEIVEGLARRGLRVHYLLRKERYWANVLDEAESRIVEGRLRHEGVTLHYHSDVEALLGKRGRVTGLRLAGGEQLACSLVAFAVGIRPRLELARAAGLNLDRGILVNEYLETGVARIYAAGDAAQVYDPLSGRHILDSLWNPAREQGRVAGLNMAGQRTAYIKKAAFNVTRLAGLTTTIIGAVGGGQDADLVGIARGDSEAWRDLPHAIACQTHTEVNRVRVMVGRRTLIGAVVMGDQTLSQPLQELITEQVDISPMRAALIQPGGAVVDRLLDFWSEWRQTHGPQ
ncbi:MAG: NAD(P)/FAD-dependent oxidoreductase [Chloroflexi bacterium]|nr:NAD(P)/FAD-dependent oxidoreductase [Chloroflexota bacterium]